MHTFTATCTKCKRKVEESVILRDCIAKYGTQCPPCSDRLAGERSKRTRRASALTKEGRATQ